MPKYFLNKKRKQNIEIQCFNSDNFAKWLKKQSQNTKNQIKNASFEAKSGQIFVLHDKNNDIHSVLAGMSDQPDVYDFAKIANSISNNISDSLKKSASFELCGIKDHDQASIGWGLAHYKFDHYKKSETCPLNLVINAKANKTRIHGTLEAITSLRDLVNIPANDLGPAEIEKAVKKLAKPYKATVKTVLDKKLVEQNFPLIYTVGQAGASDRRPRLIELNWGKAKNPKVTLVGKGVSFDTGGLDIKPSQYMRYMKKDMGGAAHAIALASLIMSQNLPVRLNLLIPAVENSVASDSFRPGDIIKSRKGLTVENTNTDAEGRLILADTLTYACENKPDLIIDFATLTGSARAALGPDIPAMFSNNGKLTEKLKKISHKAHDPVWAMPLHHDYKKYIEGSISDLVNSAGLPGDLIYSALFLESFLSDNAPDWIHLDCYAWEHSGKPGRAKGAADTGLLATFALIEDLYGRQS